MKAVIQRVLEARLSVGGETVSHIGPGLVVFLGVGAGDTKKQADIIVKKTANLRIFEDHNQKMNLSAIDLHKEILLVSQFTLYADCSRGNRPGFEQAGKPGHAGTLYEYAAEQLRLAGLTVKQGIFGADMQIYQVNDGPVTIILEYPAGTGQGAGKRDINGQ